jgi:hypothetical protein
VTHEAINSPTEICKPLAAAPVVTKNALHVVFGNYGFIRVRRRTRGAPWPSNSCKGLSRSFDLVRAVRINGKPRHRFILGLGSQKEGDDAHYFYFWIRAFRKLRRHGLDAHRFADAMVRKGAQPPPPCEQAKTNWPFHADTIDDIAAWLTARAQNLGRPT